MDSNSHTLSLTEARKNFFQLARQVQSPSVHFVLTENGSPKAVLMSAREFEAWQETLETLLDFPDIKADIKRAEVDYRKGNFTPLGLLVAEEKPSYDASPRPKKGPKRAGNPSS